nr:hypothetical protein [Tanacetum cinerariifolium]
MTDADNVNVELEKVNQEVAGDQVKDDAQATVTAAPTTQKTEVPLPSSYVSSNYAAKFLNFDNIPFADTEIISMMEIKVQHKDLTTTIPLPIPPFNPLPQQSTPIPTPTTIEETISSTIVPDSTTLTAIHQRVSDLEKEVKILKDINHDSTILAAIKSKVPYAVKECLVTNLDDTIKKMIKKQLAEFIQEYSIPAADAMDKGVVDMLKKRKPDDTDKDEGPPAGPDQGLKRKKTSKEIKPSKKAKPIGTFKGTTKSQPKSIGKSFQAEETVFQTADTQVPHNPEEDIGKTIDDEPTQNCLKDLAKAEKPSKTFNELMSTPIDFTAFAMNHLQISDLTKAELVGPVYNLLKGTCKSYVKLEYNIEECYKALNDQLD